MNKAVLLFLATSIGLGLVSLHLVRELHAQREQAQQLQVRVAELERTDRSRIARRPTPFKPAPTATAQSAPGNGERRVMARSVRLHNDSLQTAPSAPDPVHQEGMGRIREHMERQRELLRDPEYRDAMRTQHKMMLVQNYTDLEQELGVSAEEADRLLDVLAEQQLRSMEHAQLWHEDQPDAAAVQRRQQEWQLQMQANEAEIAALLGHAKLQAWKDYQNSMGVRHEVTQLRSMLASKGEPLRDDQVKPLQRILAGEQQRMMQEWSSTAGPAQAGLTTEPHSPVDFQERQLELMTRHTQHVLDAAAQILTPNQLEHLRQQQEQRLKMQEAQLKISRAQSQADHQGGAMMPAGGQLLISGSYTGRIESPQE